MLVDHITGNILIEIAGEEGLSVGEVTAVIDKYYKAVAEEKKKGTVKIKLDYLGSFNRKKHENRNARPNNS